MKMQVKGFTVIIKKKKFTKYQIEHIKECVHDGIQSWLSTQYTSPDVIVFDIDKDYKNGKELIELRNKLIQYRNGVDVK